MNRHLVVAWRIAPAAAALMLGALFLAPPEERNMWRIIIGAVVAWLALSFVLAAISEIGDARKRRREQK